MDPGITMRLSHRIRADFADGADRATKVLEGTSSGNQDRERVIAAVVLGANGDLRTLRELVELSHLDWRDLLVSGGLAGRDWRQILDDVLGSSD